LGCQPDRLYAIWNLLTVKAGIEAMGHLSKRLLLVRVYEILASALHLLDTFNTIREHLLNIFSESHLSSLRDHGALNVGLIVLDLTVAHLALVFACILGPWTI
jgi:hypothetical protein